MDRNLTHSYQLLSTDLNNVFKIGVQFVDLTCVPVVVTSLCKLVRLYVLTLKLAN